jgi:hypothetical protein
MSCSILISIRAHSFNFVSRKQSLSCKFLSMQRDKNCQRAHTLRLFQFCVAFAPRGPTGLHTDYTTFVVQAACSQRAEMGSCSLLHTPATTAALSFPTRTKCTLCINNRKKHFIFIQAAHRVATCRHTRADAQ